jgi:N-acyl homoserine lactone hydrolase
VRARDSLGPGPSFVAQQAWAQAPDMALSRLDCGTPNPPTAVNQRFSDTYSYGDLKLQLVYSCYLIKHGDDYLLWDVGHAMTTPNVAPKVSLLDQLAKIDLSPSRSSTSPSATITATTSARPARFPRRRC